MPAKTAYDFSFDAIAGGKLALSQFRGHPLLVVNVASECGLTPQYSALEALWKTKKGKGLVVLGVPSNDFGGQEPGSESEIRKFCETRYRVDFPMTAKVKVIGGEAHPLYQWVAQELGGDAAPRWNFHKYLFDKKGAIAGTFPSKLAPDAPELVKAIDAALAG